MGSTKFGKLTDTIELLMQMLYLPELISLCSTSQMLMMMVMSDVTPDF